MKSFKSIAKVLVGGLLGTGEHKCTITEIGMDLSKPSPNWSDRTPQIKTVFKNDKGTITQWNNLKGYKTIKDFANGVAPKGFEFRSSEAGDENYLVNLKTNERVESPDKTATCERMFAEMGNDAGIAEGADFTISDLIGKEVGVVVRAKGKGVEVHYTKPASRVRVESDVEDFG
jgi:hypothetical protein